jgi:hypothetical protein
MINLKKTFLTFAIVSLTASALMGIYTVLFGWFDDILQEKIILTTVAVGFYSLLGLCSAALYETGRKKKFSVFGMSAAVVAFVYSLLLIFKVVDRSVLGDAYISRLLFSFILLSLGSAYVSILFLINSNKPIVNNLLYATVGCITITFGVLFCSMWLEYTESFYMKTTLVFAILSALGTLVTPILNKMYD